MTPKVVLNVRLRMGDERVGSCAAVRVGKHRQAWVGNDLIAQVVALNQDRGGRLLIRRAGALVDGLLDFFGRCSTVCRCSLDGDVVHRSSVLTPALEAQQGSLSQLESGCASLLSEVCCTCVKQPVQLAIGEKRHIWGRIHIGIGQASASKLRPVRSGVAKVIPFRKWSAMVRVIQACPAAVVDGHL